MAKKTITTTAYTDDLDGGVAAGTVRFGFEGVNYEIDLSKSNARALERVLAPYVGHAHKAPSSRSRGGSRRPAGKHDAPAVRQWAAANGFEISERGRVAHAVLEAYDAAH